MGQKNSVRVIGADFSVGRLQNDAGEFQTALMVGFQVAFFITDDGATEFYNSLGDALSEKVVHLPSGLALDPGPRMDVPKGA